MGQLHADFLQILEPTADIISTAYFSRVGTLIFFYRPVPSGQSFFFFVYFVSRPLPARFDISPLLCWAGSSTDQVNTPIDNDLKGCWPSTGPCRSLTPDLYIHNAYVCIKLFFIPKLSNITLQAEYYLRKLMC